MRAFSRALSPRCLAGVLLAAASSLLALEAASQSPPSPESLFESTCSQCHSLELPRSQRMNKEEWKSLVERMRSNGCSITDQEAATIVEYLSKEYGR
ncbi:MAG: hypothetical protein K8I29_09265 [Alphaproteobacteria bacterium]|uniref:Quinohemoprotein amine dehydrogenase alpha subunit haem binding domain-containing protein n=1 Tax=Candidatus Nitrobium versatile TaxID=2884831 RepID=A0A953JAI9_9BACT|nr:hypothetical protein [Candidatus Nitrobium versatile]